VIVIPENPVRLLLALAALLLVVLGAFCAAHRRRDVQTLGFLAVALLGFVTVWGQVDGPGPVTVRTVLLLLAVALADAWCVITLAIGYRAARRSGL